MAFSGAPRVIHVSTSGVDTNSGSSWSTAVRTIAGALSKLPGGNGLILVAPGANAQLGLPTSIDVPNITIQGAGPGTRIVPSSNNTYGVRVTASNVEFVDLEIDATDTEGDSTAILCDSPDIADLRIVRCTLTGKQAVNAYKTKGVLIQDSAIEGTQNALLLGNKVDIGVELYDCIAANSDFRIKMAGGIETKTIVVNGGELTAINCNFTADLTATTAGVEGLYVENGGRIVLMNCAVVVDKGGSSSNVGIRLIGPSSAMKITACSTLVRGGLSNASIVPNDAARMMADACLLTPPWS